jgi:hypothetical protein
MAFLMPVDPLQKIDRDLHKRAGLKLLQGMKLSTKEEVAYKRVEKLQEKARRDEVLSALPIGEYCRYAGRRINVVRAQGEQYGLPLSEAKVNVPAVIAAFHDFLRDNWTKLKTGGRPGPRPQQGGDFDDELFGEGAEDGDGDLWLARCREKKSKLLDLELQQKEGSLIPRDETMQLLSRSAGMLRQLEEELDRRFGPDAADLAKAAREGLEREISTEFELDAA